MSRFHGAEDRPFRLCRTFRGEMQHWDAITTPALPRAITLPNASSTSAVPYRSTLRIVAGDACDGDTPAAWIVQ